MKQLIQHYRSYTAEQLATDPFYIEWVFHPFSEVENEWVSLMDFYPAITAAMLKARQYLRRFTEGEDQCPMVAESVKLYISMKNDIALTQKKKLKPTSITEKCFSICQKYWAIVRNDLLSHVFNNAEHEIHFFKVIKPIFTSELEYFGLQYHASLFCNDASADEQRQFWERQKQKKERFKTDNAAFYGCYINGCTGNDDAWFRRVADAENDQSSHDHLVAGWLALERFSRYVDSQLMKWN